MSLACRVTCPVEMTARVIGVVSAAWRADEPETSFWEAGDEAVDPPASEANPVAMSEEPPPRPASSSAAATTPRTVTRMVASTACFLVMRL
jgi:hypothetical protein